MAHVREQIRDRIITLVTGLTTTGANVFRSRVYPMESAKTPGLCVYTTQESSDVVSMAMGSAPALERNLTVVIEGYARAAADLDETLDDIAVEVEEAIAADKTLNGLAKFISIDSTSIQLLGDGDRPIGVIKFVFETLYKTSMGDVETAV